MNNLNNFDMTHYIDAEKLIAEIDDRLHCNGAYDEVGDSSWHYDQGMIDAYKHLREVITSLQQEQQEVDLEEEIARENEKWACYEEIGFGALYDARPFDSRDIDRIARHFYELGLNARKEE